MAMTLRRLALLVALVIPAHAAFAQCPATVPAANVALPGPLPVFPADNWWNTDISGAPVDANSSSFISFVGATRKLHPDFGGEESAGSTAIYGMPYAIVDGTQPRQAVTFDYWDESDGVDYATGKGVPFYPLPAQAITQPHWVEGGAPASVDQRSDGDRHLLVIDCTNRRLYELYNVWYDSAQAKWYAGSGAFFDLNASQRRPEGWTSADAAGLAIFPGLVRYDEAWSAAVTDIGHAFRVTVRATNGYVYPASHRAGSTSGALPMGARLRLKASVNGQDPALRTSDVNVRKIFRAMQKYGLIVADNGSDMYITGTFDTRWNNDILNPAFAMLSAGDFEVVELGWKPTAAPGPALAAVSASPSVLTGGGSATGTVTLGSAAPSAVVVALSSASMAVSVPESVTVGANATSATFAIATAPVAAQTATSIVASYAGAQKSTTLTLNPPAAAALASLAVSPTSVVGGNTVSITVMLTSPAPAQGAAVTLRSSSTLVPLPSSVTVPAGATSRAITVKTRATKRESGVSLFAVYAGTGWRASLTVKAQ